jgi:hypothetical protein
MARAEGTHLTLWESLASTPQPAPRLLPERQAIAGFPGGYLGAVNVRPREAADQAAAEASLARHNSLRVVRLGELVHPLNYTMWRKVVPGVRLDCGPPENRWHR